MSKPQKAVLLSTQRSGTILMVTMLDQHPDLLSVGEIFKHNNQINYPEYWYSGDVSVDNHMERLYSLPDYKAISFKLMLNQAKSKPDILPALLNRKVKCILVRRNNILKIYLSHLRAMEKNVWVSNQSSNVPQSRLHINIEDMLDEMSKLSQVQVELAEIATRFKDHLVVEYESFIANKTMELNRLFKFIGLGPVDYKIEATTVKLSPDTLKDSVENYEEVVNCIKATPYEKYLF